MDITTIDRWQSFGHMAFLPWVLLLELLTCFLGFQASFPWFDEILKETSMPENFTDSI